ncbi:MAG: hypothetical protein K2X82_32850 [Gemmataceae bacterium]|nr:hypothetical protein [Gemmataceae bacterium]
MTTAEPAFPESLDPIKAELATLYRELPRLLAEGQAGRFVLVKGEAVIDLYEDNTEAVAAGCRLGVPFLTQRVDPDDRDWLAVYFEPRDGDTAPRLRWGRSVERVKAEFITYFRELPRLLAEGHDRRFVLLKGDEVVGVYDDNIEASRAGAARYGRDPYLVQWVKRRDLDWRPELLASLARGEG